MSIMNFFSHTDSVATSFREFRTRTNRYRKIQFMGAIDSIELKNVGRKNVTLTMFANAKFSLQEDICDTCSSEIVVHDAIISLILL